jgi:predicted helicase
MNLKDYSNFIKQNSKNATEHTFRTPLENLLNDLKLDSSIEIIHEAKKESGVYYTPPIVTNFIVRGVSDILESKFKLKDRFLDKDIKILDFATGTGTFLLNIFDELLLKIDNELYHERIKDKIFNDIFGFEQMASQSHSITSL